jgi:hypothetical protein
MNATVIPSLGQTHYKYFSLTLLSKVLPYLLPLTLLTYFVIGGFSSYNHSNEYLRSSRS